MWGALVVGLLFLAGCVYNIVGPEPNPVEAAGGAVVSAALFGLFFFSRSEQNRTSEFVSWMTRNAYQIRRGEALHNGILVTPDTVLAQYQYTLSFFVVTYKIPTRLYIVGHDRTTAVAAFCIVTSFLFGWCGLPWGPIYTVQTTAGNLRGGHRCTVGQRLNTHRH